MPSTRRSGLAINFEVEGSGRPVLLLHGAAGSLEVWRFTGYVDALADAFQVILVDARGHGRSDRPRDGMGRRAHVRDCLAVLDELGVQVTAAVGFSMGGMTALALAGLHPERVSAVVDIDGDVDGVGFDDHTVDEPDDWDLPRLVEREGLSSWISSLEEEGRPRWADVFRRMDPETFLEQVHSWWRPERLGIRLSDLTTPIFLVLTEENTRNLPPLPAQARVLPIPYADHVGTLEAKDVVLPAIRELLRSAGDPTDHGAPLAD